MPRVVYTDEQRSNALAVLIAEGRNITSAARVTGIERGTLRQWARAAGIIASSTTKEATAHKADLAELTGEKSLELAVLFEREVRAAIGSLPDKREAATYRELLTGVGILTDKIQLLRGLPTERSEVRNVDERLEEFTRKLAGLAPAGAEESAPN